LGGRPETLMEHDPHGDEKRREAEPAGAPDERRIRQRAHEIWIEEGRPDGRALDHWLRARWELETAPDPKAEVERLERDVETGAKAG